MNYKTLLGNLLVNAMEEGQVALPESRYVKDDYRLVKRDKGSFRTEVDNQGRHGDTFDSDKLALHGLQRLGGPVHAEAAQVGTFGVKKDSGWDGPLERELERMNQGVKTYV